MRFEGGVVALARHSVSFPARTQKVNSSRSAYSLQIASVVEHTVDFSQTVCKPFAAMQKYQRAGMHETAAWKAGSQERLMGLEPTTFCMASSC
jgi:hypothetical protein